MFETSGAECLPYKVNLLLLFGFYIPMVEVYTARL